MTQPLRWSHCGGATAVEPLHNGISSQKGICDARKAGGEYIRFAGNSGDCAADHVRPGGEWELDMALAVMVIMALGGGMAEKPAPEPGVCSYYNPGVMERVAEYRGLAGMEGIVGYAAVLNCEQIGELVTINDQGPFRVVDCAERKHKANLAARGIVAEVDYETAMRWGMFGPVACEVRQ